MSNTSSKRNLLLKSLQRAESNLNRENDIHESKESNFVLNTKKIPVNLKSEENVKHLIHKREDLLNNIQNIDLEIETAIRNLTTDDNNNQTQTQNHNNHHQSDSQPGSFSK